MVGTTKPDHAMVLRAILDREKECDDGVGGVGVVVAVVARGILGVISQPSRESSETLLADGRGFETASAESPQQN